MGVFGDSLTTIPSYQEPLAAALGWTPLNLSTGGWTTTDLLAAIPGTDTQLYATDSVILIGINDVIAGASAASIIANLQAISALVRNPRLVCLLPFGGYSGWTSDKETVRRAVNTYIRTTPRYTDAETLLGDGDGTQPRLQGSYANADGLHLTNPLGDSVLAAAILNQSFR